jgi:hypothetical protein
MVFTMPLLEIIINAMHAITHVLIVLPIHMMDAPLVLETEYKVVLLATANKATLTSLIRQFVANVTTPATLAQAAPKQSAPIA